MTTDLRQRRSDLFQMTWPMLVGVLSMMSFQLVDSYFIAKLGTDPLAVVGFTIPMYQLVVAFQVGVGIAITALISQLIGAGNHEGASTLGSQLLLLGSVTIASLCLMLWLFRSSIIMALGGNESLLALVDSFWSIWLVSVFVGAMVYFAYSICRAHGNTKLPGTTMVLTSLLNMVLDPIFIFVLDLHLVGAAYASLTSFTIGAIIAYPKIFKMQWLGFSGFLSTLRVSLQKISAIAAPALVSQLLPAAAASISTAIVAEQGIAAVAAWGLGVRVEYLSLVLILALTMSLPPMIGREFGAKRYNEIGALIKLTLRYILMIQAGVAVFLLLCSGPLSRVLSPETEVAQSLQLILMVIPFSYGPLGVCMIMVSSANAVSQPLMALMISFIRLFICYIPFLWLGSVIAGYQGIVMGAVIGNVLAGVCAWQVFRRISRQWE